MDSYRIRIRRYIVKADEINDLLGSNQCSHTPLIVVRSEKLALDNHKQERVCKINQRSSTVLRGLTIVHTSAEEELSHLFWTVPFLGKGYTLHLFILHCLTSKKALNPNPT